MKSIIVDDEPLGRQAIQLLIEETTELSLLNKFSSTAAAAKFLASNVAELIFLDIQMPGINGIDFAKAIPGKSLIVFTTAHPEYALDSYDVGAIDYLLKPIEPDRFRRAVNKALSYHRLLAADHAKSDIESISDGYFFIRAERRIFKISFMDILFVEGLNNYVVIQTTQQKVITAMNIKLIYEQLPGNIFVRVSKSYVVNVRQIDSCNNNSIFIGKNEIPIGNAYRSHFFEEFVAKKLLGR